MSVLLPFSILGAPGDDDALDVADVFSTDLYTGNGTSQSITNGVDLSGKGGLVWLKARSNTSAHVIFDTVRGFGNYLSPEFGSGENFAGDLGWGSGSFNSDGYTVVQGTNGSINGNTTTFVGWSFRRAPKFFDVVTYTGDGTSGRAIAHNLGVAPGLILIKKTYGIGPVSSHWYVYHRSSGNTSYLTLSTTAAVVTNATNPWSSTAPTTAVFTVNGSSEDVNVNTATYVAYLFAHDTSASGFIQCGSYTGNGSASGPTITLGWEPQWLLVKQTNTSRNWILVDSARGFPASPSATPYIITTYGNAESTASGTLIETGSTGFEIVSTDAQVNDSGGTYIYMAVRSES